MIMTENVTDPEVNQLNSKQSIPSNQTTRLAIIFVVAFLFALHDIKLVDRIGINYTEGNWGYCKDNKCIW